MGERKMTEAKGSEAVSKTAMTSVKRLISKFRKRYQHKFTFRCLIFLATAALLFLSPEQFDVMEGWNFFRRFSVFHLLWVVWMVDMIFQLIPCRKYLPLGSQKFLLDSFRPQKIFSPQRLMEYVRKSNRGILLVGVCWSALTALIGILYFVGVIKRNILFLLAVAFYVCDLICVLFWCPFRVWFMKNRCCTTCRIFNWDHMMMFSPFLFVPGFYTWSLLSGGIVVFIVWEASFSFHPERFWEGSNEALQCVNCTDRLCGERNCVASLPNLSNKI